MKYSNPNCGEELKENWKICPVCQTPAPKEIKCSSCAEILRPEWKICPACQKSVDKQAAASNDQFCVVCGKVLIGTAYFKCQECGHLCCESDRVPHPEGLVLPICRQCGIPIMNPILEERHRKQEEEARRLLALILFT